MLSIACILLLVAILSRGYGETTVSILEDPVLLEFNATHTALRCSIEVYGNVRPRIDFFFNNLSYSEITEERCNGNYELPFSPDGSYQAGECGNSSYRIRHQVFFVRTCFGDPTYTSFINSTVVQCAPSSTAVNLTVTSNRVRLTYSERYEPRLVPETVPLQSLRVQERSVCPGEPVGVLSLQSPVSIVSPTSTTKEVDSTSLTQTSTSFIATTSTSTPSKTIPGPFGSSPDAPPTQPVTPPSQTPSASTTPPSSSNPSGSPTPDNRNQDGESISTFTEEELKLIIFVATGVAVFFAGVVVFLLCVLCCVLTKRRKNTNLSGSRKKAMEGLTDNDDHKETIRLERLERASLSPIQTTEPRERQQFALHRGSSGSSASNSNSIDSDTLGRDHPSGNPTTDVIVARQQSRNCTAVANPLVEEVVTGVAVEEHDYDYIDDSKLTSSSPGKKDTPVQAAAAPVGKKNSYVKGPLEGEYNVPRLCVSDTQSESIQGFPVTDSLKRECAVQLSSALLSEETKLEKKPPTDYVNRPNDIHHYQNSLMIGTDIHDYQNSNAVQCGTQTIPAISDSYQELHTISDDDLTVGDSSSSSYFNHLKGFPHTSGYEAETTSSSCFEQVPTGLSQVQRTQDEQQGTSGEPYYHTVIPGGGTSDSSCSTGAYSLPPDVKAMIKSKSSGPTSYNNPLLKHEGSSKTVPQASKREHVYKDLDTYKMDAPTDYTDLQKSLNTSIGTQTYA